MTKALTEPGAAAAPAPAATMSEGSGTLPPTSGEQDVVPLGFAA